MASKMSVFLDDETVKKLDEISLAERVKNVNLSTRPKVIRHLIEVYNRINAPVTVPVVEVAPEIIIVKDKDLL